MAVVLIVENGYFYEEPNQTRNLLSEKLSGHE